MKTTIFELALKVGQICTFVSLALHLIAGLLPLSGSLRQELTSCTKEAGNSGILFLVFAWIFGVQTIRYEVCAQWLVRFCGFYMAVYLILIIGSALMHRRQDGETRQIGRQLKKSSLLYGIIFFAMTILLG